MLAVAVGVVLFVAGDAAAQEMCSLTYYGEEHSGDWDYLTIDATSRGQPMSSGITIHDKPTRVCGHDGGRSAEGFYCGEPADHEWRLVWPCGGGGGDDDGSGDTSPQRVKLSMVGDSEWVMENDGPTEVSIKAELTVEPRDRRTTVMVHLDPHEATPGDDFEPVPDFQMVIEPNRMSDTHTFTFEPTDDETEERDENLRFTGDSGESDLPVDPTTLMIKDNDRGARDDGDDADGDDADGDDADGDDADGDDHGTVRPPRFSDAHYTFDLPEHHDGRREPLRLGVVSARDPNGQPLTYTLVTGDGSRFEVDASSGTFAYVGPGEDYETGPERYELWIRARNRDRRTADVSVTVTVTDEAEAPVAADDTAETPEDEPTEVDILANDSHPDGDRLRVVSVTAPEHGTVSVVSGGIRYVPEPSVSRRHLRPGAAVAAIAAVMPLPAAAESEDIYGDVGTDTARLHRATSEPVTLNVAAAPLVGAAAANFELSSNTTPTITK